MSLSKVPEIFVQPGVRERGRDRKEKASVTAMTMNIEDWKKNL